MHRRLLLIAVTLGLIASAASAREASSFRAGAQPEPKVKGTEPDGRAKIIDEIRSDLDDVVDKLNRRDPGAQTRARQDRIVKNIDKLLEQDDPPPESGSNRSNSTPPPPKSKDSPPPRPQSPAQEKPPGSQPKPAPMQQATPSGDALSKSTSKDPSTNPPAAPDAWPRMPWRDQPGVDALSRGRFVPRYEELLRQYYRSLAESRRGED